MAAEPVKDKDCEERGSAPVMQSPEEKPASCALCFVCMLVIFLSRLEVSVLTLVIPHIAREFGCSIEFAAWVNFLPSFAGTMFSPSVGKFSDMYGHAGTWRASVLLLAFSTWLSAWSPSLFMLLLARGMTGFAGNGIMNPSLPLMSKGLDKERRGAIQSYMSSVDALGSSTGVLFGGMLIDRLSWRAIFLVPAPLLTLMWACSWLVVRQAPKSRGPSSAPPSPRGCPLLAFDWPGTLLFALMSFCLLFAINRGNDQGWRSPLVLGLFLGAAALMPALARVEARARHPILPLWLFSTRARVLLTLTSAVTWSCYGSCFLLVPLYMQDALAMQAGKIGNLLTVRPVAGSLMAALMSRLIERKSCPMRTLARRGAAMQLASYGLLNLVAALPEGAPFFAALELQLVLQASGAFCTGLPTNAMFVATLPEDQLANATAMRGVVIGFVSLCVQTSNLSLIRAIGSEFEPRSYQPTWVILACLQLLVLVSTRMVPASAELGYSSAAQTEAVEAGGGKAEVLESGAGQLESSPVKACISGGAALAAASVTGELEQEAAVEEEPEGEEEETQEQAEESEAEEGSALDHAAWQTGSSTGVRKVGARASRAVAALGGRAVNGIKGARRKVGTGAGAGNACERAPFVAECGP